MCHSKVAADADLKAVSLYLTGKILPLSDKGRQSSGIGFILCVTQRFHMTQTVTVRNC